MNSIVSTLHLDELSMRRDSKGLSSQREMALISTQFGYSQSVPLGPNAFKVTASSPTEPNFNSGQ